MSGKMNIFYRFVLSGITMAVVLFYFSDYSRRNIFFICMNVVIAFLLVCIAEVCCEETAAYQMFTYIFIFHNLSLIMYFHSYLLREGTEIGKLAMFKPSISLAVVLTALTAGYYLAAKQVICQDSVLLVLALAGPLAFLLARVTNGQIRGVYNWLGGRIMPSEIQKLSLVCLLPLLRKRDERDTKKTMLFFFGYLLVGILISAACNEYGTVMFILIYGMFVIINEFNNKKILAAMAGVTAVSAATAIMVSEKVRDRFLDFLDPMQSDIGRRILTQLPYLGIWGSELELTKKDLPPNELTDYVIATLYLEFGYLALAAVIIGMVVLLVYMNSIRVRTFQERKLVVSSCFVLMAACFISIGTNLFVLPLTGMTIPFITTVGSIQSNCVIFLILGIVFGLRERRSP